MSPVSRVLLCPVLISFDEDRDITGRRLSEVGLLTMSFQRIGPANPSLHGGPSALSQGSCRVAGDRCGR